MSECTVYSHQMDAIRKLHQGSILVGGVGTGKSRTSLGYFYKVNGGTFCEVTNDKGEILGYSVKDRMRDKPLDLVIITTAKKRDSMEWEEELMVYLMSTDSDLNAYENKITIDSWNNIGKYEKITNSFIIFDEQRVGGTGKWAKTFIKIARQNKWILLSATPGDTWSDYAPVFIANNFYKNFTQFRARHCVYSRFTKYPKIDHYVECSVLEKHRSDILVYMPFKKSTIAHHEYVKVDYDSETYGYVLKKRWNVYKDSPCKEIAELCAVLRKIVNSDKSRIEAILKIFNDHKRVIIFYNYDYELELLREMCQERYISFAEWNGHKHEKIPDNEEWVYLVQYRSGAEGWNCILTDCIAFYSQTYSYKDSIQAAGRIDRLNTPYTDLYYYHLISSSKMDIAINRCLKSKKDFNELKFIEGGTA